MASTRPILAVAADAETLVELLSGIDRLRGNDNSVEGKKYWEVPPLQCQVVLPSGEEQRCKSDDEFKDLIKLYME